MTNYTDRELSINLNQLMDSGIHGPEPTGPGNLGPDQQN